MAAPLQSYLNLYRSTSVNSKNILKGSRLLHFCCPLLQKKKSTKIKNVELDDLFPSTSTSGGKSRGNLSEVSRNNNLVDNKTLTFQQLLQKGYLEARRSLLIRTENAENTLRSLASYGGISLAQYVMPDKNFLLLEFANEMTPDKIKNNATLFSEQNQFPMRSRILCDTKSKTNNFKKSSIMIATVSDGNWHIKNSENYPPLTTLDEEMVALSVNRSLDEYDLRLRFFVCMLLEDLVQSVLPGARVLPYGSCLNGFGWWSSDLDMMLCLKNEPYSGLVMKPHREPLMPSQFRFVTETFFSDRHLAQRTLAMIAALLELTPRVESMVKILNARVPIIRFRHEAVNMLCDISVHSIDSIKMTEMLYLYSVSDPRVKPLMATIKQWAVSHKLTSGGEQQKFTTIGLLTMLIFFLQTRSPAVVPTLREIQSLAKSSELFYIDDVKFGLPGNQNVLPKSKNSESLESLLIGFFQFYSQFDFAKNTISITEGQTFDKPEDSRPVCMENPLCVGLNICQNVGAKPLEVLKESMRHAALRLEELAAAQKTTEPKLSSLFSENLAVSRLSVLFQSSESEHTLDVEELISDEPLTSEVETSKKSEKKQSPHGEIVTLDADNISSSSDNISDDISRPPSKDFNLNQISSTSSPVK